MPMFEIGPDDFLLDGAPHQVISGALHYFRVHPDQWADRIHKAKLMGLNTIETYVAWNFHSSSPQQFDLTGRRDLARFLDLVAEEGLHAVVRPGPYICAEWDNGGLPAWLLATPGIGIRTSEPQFLDAIERYFSQVLPLVAERQIDRGGCVIAVQVENEYGAYGDADADARALYLRSLVSLMRGQGITVPLVTCDQADREMLIRGGLPELHKTATFGSRATERLAILREQQPAGPLMCMEFWDGWFDSWGLQHHVAPHETNAQDLDHLLAAGGSVNLYMFHGGTNFGFTNGANDKGAYYPITTSYDYDAPLAEDGSPTAKYDALREVIARHAPVPSETCPRRSLAPSSEVVLDRGLSLWDALPLLGGAAEGDGREPRGAGGPVTRAWDCLPTMDNAEHWSGFMIYRARILPDDDVLSVAEVRDRAMVFVDREPVGVLDRASGMNSVALPPREGMLEILVEDQGRVNYGRRLGEPKGLIGPARTVRRNLMEWETLALRLESVDTDALAAAAGDAGRSSEAPHAVDDGRDPLAGPSFRIGSFDSEAGVDHVLSLRGWGKGLVWVNGFLLGRYWSASPTRTLYVPGPLVTQGANQLMVLELQGAASAIARFVAEPDLGPEEI